MELNRKQGRNSEIFEGSLKGASPPVPQKGPQKARKLVIFRKNGLRPSSSLRLHLQRS